MRRHLAVTAALVAVAAGCGSAGGTEAAAPTAAAPVASAVTTPSGVWATLALGHLDDPVNTFWQLLERPAGSATWSVQTTGTETATNGGLLVAPGAAGQLIVAVPPSQELGYTPVVTVAGTTFTAAGPAPALAAGASTLAAGDVGEVAVAAGGGRLVADASPQSGAWQTLASAADIGRASGCGTPTLDAVAVTSGGVLSGGTCAAPGRVGLWESSGQPGAAWRLRTADVPPALRRDRTNVVYVAPSGAAIVAAGPEIFAVDGASTSAPLTAGTIEAASATPAGGLCVVVGDPTTPQIDIWAPGQPAWSALPAAPAGTAVAFVDGDTATALTATPSGNPTTITVYTLAPGMPTWQRGQVLAVTVPYGSSGSSG